MRKSSKPQPSVLDATDLVGFDDQNMMLKLYGGVFAGVLHVHGIDADGMHQDDKERLYYAWSNAETTCELPRKIVLCDAKLDLSRQREHIRFRLQNPYNQRCEDLLRREEMWIDELEKLQKERIGYIIFYGTDPASVRSAMRLYAQKLSAAQIKAIPLDTLDGLQALGRALYRPTM